MSVMDKYVTALNTLEVTVKWDRIPYLSLKENLSTRAINKLHKLHLKALAKGVSQEQITRLKILFKNVWEMIMKRPTPEEFSDQLFLEMQFFPLFNGISPEIRGIRGSVNQEFLSDLHDIILLRESLLAGFDHGHKKAEPIVELKSLCLFLKFKTGFKPPAKNNKTEWEECLNNLGYSKPNNPNGFAPTSIGKIFNDLTRDFKSDSIAGITEMHYSQAEMLCKKHSDTMALKLLLSRKNEFQQKGKTSR